MYFSLHTKYCFCNFIRRAYVIIADTPICETLRMFEHNGISRIRLLSTQRLIQKRTSGFEITTAKSTHSTTTTVFSTSSVSSSSVSSSVGLESGAVKFVMSQQILIGVTCTLLVTFLLLAFTVVLKKKVSKLLRRRQLRESRSHSVYNEDEAEDQMDPVYDEVGLYRNRSSSIGTGPYAISPFLPPRVPQYSTMPNRKSATFKLRSPKRGRNLPPQPMTSQPPTKLPKSAASSASSATPITSNGVQCASSKRQNSTRDIKESSIYFDLKERKLESEDYVYDTCDVSSSVLTRGRGQLSNVSEPYSGYVRLDSKPSKTDSRGDYSELKRINSNKNTGKMKYICNSNISFTTDNKVTTNGHSDLYPHSDEDTPGYMHMNDTNAVVLEDDGYVWPDQDLATQWPKQINTSRLLPRPEKQRPDTETCKDNGSQVSDDYKRCNGEMTVSNSVCAIRIPQIQHKGLHEEYIEFKTFGKCLNTFVKRQDNP